MSRALPSLLVLFLWVPLGCDDDSRDPDPVSVTSSSLDLGPVEGGTLLELEGSQLGLVQGVVFRHIEEGDVFEGQILEEERSDTRLMIVTPGIPCDREGEYAIDLLLDELVETTPFRFTYFAQPVVDRFEPGLSVLEGGGEIVIEGRCFLPGAVVRFDGVEAPAVRVEDPQSIVAVIPSRGEAGVVSISVTNSNGRSSRPIGPFSYSSPPSIVAVTPSGRTGSIFPLGFEVIDAESDLVDLTLTRTSPGPETSLTLTLGSQSAGLASSPTGLFHQLYWDVRADLGEGASFDVAYRVDVRQAGTSLTGDSVTVQFPLDLPSAFELGSGQVEAGQTLTVDWSLRDDQGVALSGCQTDVCFDASSLALLEVTAAQSAVDALKSVRAFEVSEGHWRILVLGENTSTADNDRPLDPGAVVSVRFEALAKASAGTYRIDVDPVLGSTLSRRGVTFVGAPSFIVVASGP